MQRVNKNNFADKCPIGFVDEGIIYSKLADITVGYELTLPEFLNVSAEQIETGHQTVMKAIKSLPPNTVVSKFDWFVNRAYQADVPLTKDFLNASNIKHFTKRNFQGHTCQLYITRLASKKQRTLSQNPILRNRLVSQDVIDPIGQQRFLDACSQFARILSSSPTFNLRPLTDSEIVGTKKNAGLIERYVTLNPFGKRVLVDLDFRGTSMNIGNKQCSMFSLADVDNMPDAVSSLVAYGPLSEKNREYPVHYAASLGMLCPVDHLYAQYLYVLDSDDETKKLEARNKQLRSLAKQSRKNEVGADHIEAFLHEAAQSKRQIIRAHYNVTTWTSSEVELRAYRNEVATRIAALGAIPKEENTSATSLFWCGIPGAAGSLPVEESFLTFLENSACFWNMESGQHDHGTGVRVTGRLSGEPVRIDCSDVPFERKLIDNRNKFIIGASGSGKSFLINTLLRDYYDRGSDITVIDMGDSYKGLCTLLGGTYFVYTEHTRIAFNPFLLDRGQSLTIEKQNSIKAILLSLWGKEEEEDNNKGASNLCSRGETLAIIASIKDYYTYLAAHPDIRPKFDTYYEFLDKIYRLQLQRSNIREKDFDFDNMLFTLKHFYRGGTYDYLLNSDKNLDLHDERFIVFEINAIRDDTILFPVVTIIIMEMFSRKMYEKQGIRKILVIEEAWAAIAKSGMAESINFLYRTCRKFFGETWVATQNPEDVISSPIIKNAIVNNADTKLITDLDKFSNMFDDIKSFLGLSEHEALQILSLNPDMDDNEYAVKRNKKDFFVSWKGHSAVYANEVSPEEYFTYTTEEKEKYAVQRLAEHFGNFQKAIETIVTDYQGNYSRAVQEILNTQQPTDHSLTLSRAS